jgi:hypothetical protein
MARPELWPLRNLLALAHREQCDEHGLAVLGFLVVGHGPRVYVGNICDLAPGPLAPQLAGVGRVQYVSFAGLIAAGWAVD